MYSENITKYLDIFYLYCTWQDEKSKEYLEEILDHFREQCSNNEMQTIKKIVSEEDWTIKYEKMPHIILRSN